MTEHNDSNLLQQLTDFQFVELLLPFVQNRTFLDIGAEKGSFTKLLASHDFTGTLFEPLPKHGAGLKALAHEKDCIFYPFAIDDKDGIADFHIACNSEGDPLDYFHSLQLLENDKRVSHKTSIKVTCRSLNSMLKEGLINKEVGIIKTDTEGNDLHVLRGLSDLEAEIIVCEFFMPGVYTGWEQGNPYNLIEEAKKIGFEHFLAIKRLDILELLSIDSPVFLDKQWGNLIFIKNSIFEKAKKPLAKIIAKNEIELIYSFLNHSSELKSEIKKRDELIDSLRNDTTLIQWLLKRSKMLLGDKYHNLLKDSLKGLILPKLGRLHLNLPKPLIIPKHYYKKTMQKKWPGISIVTPSLNQSSYLERTIQSVLNQNYACLEYIIKDGGSVDNTTDILQRYKASLTYYESTRDNGQSAAINTGFCHATAEIMAYLNSDDMLLPGSLNYIADYFTKHPDVDVIYSHRVLINEYDQEVGRWILPPHDSKILSWSDYIPQETMFWRRRIWDKIGSKIDESFRFAMDWDLILRFREANAKFSRLPRFLGAFRVHPQQKTNVAISELGAQEMRRLIQRCHGRDISEHEKAINTRSYLFRHLLYNNLYNAGLLRY